jgi:hypothetical protein
MSEQIDIAVDLGVLPPALPEIEFRAVGKIKQKQQAKESDKAFAAFSV